MFKKRKQTENVLGGFNPLGIPYCRSSEDGERQLVTLTPDEFRQLNPVDYVDFSLSEEMRAGVDIRQLPTSGLLGDNPNMTDEEILQHLESQENKE